MGKIQECWRMELLLLGRQQITWILLALSGIYLVFGLPDRVIRFDPGWALMGSVYVTVAGILACLFYGWSLIEKEQSCGVAEVVETFPRGLSAKWLGKGLALVTVISFFILFATCIILFRYWQTGVPTVFFSQVPIYLLLYWGLPFLVAGIFGMVIGSFRLHSFAYLLLIGLWIFFSPLIISLEEAYAALYSSHWRKIFAMIGWGQTDIDTPYDPVYGLPLELYRWLKIALWLITALALLVFRYIQKTHGKDAYRKSAVVGLALAVVAVPLLWWIHQPDQPRLEKGWVSAHEVLSVPLQKGASFVIHSYQLEVDSFRQLSVQAQMKGEMQERGNTLTFTLYRGYHPTEVTTEKGKTLSFSRRGDQVLVNLPTTLQKGDPFQVTIHYQGVGTPELFANEQGVFLPGFFPWYPMANGQEWSTSNRFNPLLLEKEAEFEIHYQGPEPLCTNLKPSGQAGYYMGSSQGGPTLVAGSVKEKSIQGVQVCLPHSMYQMEQALPQFLEQLEVIKGRIKRDFPDAPKELKSPLLFVTNPTVESSYAQIPIWEQGDHTLIGITQHVNDPYYWKEPDFLLFSLMESMNRSQQFHKQDPAVVNLYFDLYHYWYTLRYKPEAGKELEERLKESFSQYGDSESKTDKQVATWSMQLIDGVRQNKSQEATMKKLFHDWTDRLQKHKPMNREQLPELIQLLQKERRSHGKSNPTE